MEKLTQPPAKLEAVSFSVINKQLTIELLLCLKNLLCVLNELTDNLYL